MGTHFSSSLSFCFSSAVVSVFTCVCVCVSIFVSVGVSAVVSVCLVSVLLWSVDVSVLGLFFVLFWSIIFWCMSAKWTNMLKAVQYTFVDSLPMNIWELLTYVPSIYHGCLPLSELSSTYMTKSVWHTQHTGSSLLHIQQAIRPDTEQLLHRCTMIWWVPLSTLGQSLWPD